MAENSKPGIPPSKIAEAMGVQPEKIVPKEWPAVGRVRSVVGRIVNLHTGVAFDTESEKKVEIDGFIRSQLDAGKFVLVTD